MKYSLLTCWCITALLLSLGLKLRNIRSRMLASSSFSVRAQIPTVQKDSMAESTVPKWAQKTVSLPPLRRGCHLVTSKVPFPLLFLPSFFPFPKTLTLHFLFSCFSLRFSDSQRNRTRPLRIQVRSCSSLL